MRPAPKDLQKNILYRRRICERAARDPEFAQQCLLRASKDFIWCCDTFFWTYDPKDHPFFPNRPFILYDYQEDAARKILKANGKHDLLFEKSRQMGCTWLIIALLVWLWQFRTRQSFLVGSRKEDLVDKAGDANSLFYKIDYIVESLPGWMRISRGDNRRLLHFSNPNNRSAFDGESTNEDFCRGGTRQIVVLDEFPAVKNGHKILKATRDATNCRLLVGTPQGAFGAYYETREVMLERNPDRVIRMHWTMHPEKRRGLYSIEGCAPGSTPNILDTEYEFTADFDFWNIRFPQFKLRSIWFNEQCARSANSHEISQEIEIDYIGSAWNYFEPEMVKRWIEEGARQPDSVGSIRLDPDWKNPIWDAHPGGEVQLWFIPTEDGKVPDEIRSVVCGVDIAHGGSGDMSSNSVASFVRRDTGEKIAQFTSNSLYPDEFCHIVLALCKWFDSAYLIFERNGGGGLTFGNEVLKSGYHRVFYQTDSEMKRFKQRTKKPGFWTNSENKPVLLANYRHAMMRWQFKNPCEEALRECLEYVNHPGGKIEHSKALASENPASQGENHGDMVIADALANRGLSDVANPELEEPERDPPLNSIAGRRLVQQREKSKICRWGQLLPVQ